MLSDLLQSQKPPEDFDRLCLTKTLFQWLGSNLFAHPVYAAVVETSGALRRVLSIGMCLLWHSQLKDRLCMATGICVVI